jgi:hypothetical protein
MEGALRACETRKETDYAADGTLALEALRRLKLNPTLSDSTISCGRRKREEQQMEQPKIRVRAQSTQTLFFNPGSRGKRLMKPLGKPSMRSKQRLNRCPHRRSCRTIRAGPCYCLMKSRFPFVRFGALNLTEAERRDVVNYEPGQVIAFHRMVKGVAVAGKRRNAIRSGKPSPSHAAKCEGTASHCRLVFRRMCRPFERIESSYNRSFSI